MTGPILLDTGPLVAMLNRREQYHSWVKAQITQIRPPMLTCEAVLSEACFLLQEIPQSSASMMQMLIEGLIQAPFRLNEEAPAVSQLLSRYTDVSMSIADASLVRMSELHPQSTVFTLDGDFHIYRRHGRQVIPLLVPR